MVDFDEMLRHCDALLELCGPANLEQASLAHIYHLRDDVRALRDAESAGIGKQAFKRHLGDRFAEVLEANGLYSGRIAEIGGAQNSFLDRFSGFEVNYLSIFPAHDERFVIADITNCPHVASDAYDAVLSVSVLEHLKHPHLAAREIVRLLKPGGITFHAVPFSYFFHGAPVDYWRMTTTALEMMFEGLETIECSFHNGDRRRNNLGSTNNRIDEDGGTAFSPDAFGGWRENWFTIYIGRKPTEEPVDLRIQHIRQAGLDLLKGLTESGLGEEAAIARAVTALQRVDVDEFGRVVVRATSSPVQPISADELRVLWRTRGKKTLRPSAYRHNLLALLTHAGVVDRA